MNIKTVIKAVFRALAMILVLTVLLPSVLKLTHAFNHHKHEVCENDTKHQTHFHESDLDCEFYKFKLTKVQYFNFLEQKLEAPISYFRPSVTYYTSLRNHQQLTRFLRGPPQLM